MIRVDSRLSVPESLIEKILARTIRCGGCLIWTGYIRNGYGSISCNNKIEYVHRIMVAYYQGRPLRRKQFAVHTCDVRNCVDRKHLLKRTRLWNISDMRRKGRGVNPPRVTGERHHLVKVSDARVAQAKRMTGTQREIARHFNVSQGTVWAWINNKTRAS